MTNQQKVPNRGTAIYSDEGKGEPGTCMDMVQSSPNFASPDRSAPASSQRRSSSSRAWRRIEIATRLINQEKYVRYQAHFPTTIKDGKATHEIPFGSIDRPNAIEFPAQNWVDYGDGRHGLALLNIGLPGNLVSDGTMLVSLLRAIRRAPTVSAVVTSRE